jgi:hypothetical protein
MPDLRRACWTGSRLTFGGILDMKSVLAVTLSLAFSTVAAFAQESTPTAGSAAIAAAAPIKISDTEAVIIEQTIRGYVETKKDKFELFDRKKGKVVGLRLDRIVTDDPACVVFPNEAQVAICGECTEVPSAMADGEKEATGDKYVIWFLVQRGSLVSAVVKDTFIKSVNGNQMYEWSKTADGSWAATVVPDPAPAP